MMFTPSAGKQYSIRLSEPLSDSVFLLPEIYNEGISLRLDREDKEYLEFVITQYPGFEKKTVYLRGQVRGMVCCIAMGVLVNELKIKIPLKEFPFQGIAEFTLFDDDLTSIAERLVYVNPEKKLYIKTELNKTRLEIKSRAKLKIAVTDENGQLISANLGISIYDKLYHDKIDPVNILSHCYLSSQIRSKIYGPASYFDTTNTIRKDALYLLLLTQGWRRYLWSESFLKKIREPKL